MKYRCPITEPPEHMHSLAGNVSVTQLNLDKVAGARVFVARGGGGASRDVGKIEEAVVVSLDMICDGLEDVRVFMVYLLLLSESMLICTSFEWKVLNLTDACVVNNISLVGVFGIVPYT